MRVLFFTADTHFNHTNIIRYCRRPFANVEEMNRVLIAKWNAVVRNDDTVYHLGDLALGDAGPILSELNGRIVLVVGSHDKAALRCRERFEAVAPLIEIREQGRQITLCHYSMRVWPRSHYNAWHLFGHSHGRLEPIGKSWDVGVDVNGLAPLSFDEVRAIMDSRPDNINCVRS